MKDMIKSFDVVEWIDKKTFYPRRFKMEMDIASETGAITSTTTINMYEHNQVGNIELPAEAQEAKEVTTSSVPV